MDNAPLEVVAAQGLDGKVLEQFRTAFKGLGDASRATRDGKTEPILAQWGIVGLVEARDADFGAPVRRQGHRRATEVGQGPPAQRERTAGAGGLKAGQGGR